MKFSTMTRLGLIAPFALAVSACGGGGVGGDGGGYANVSPIAGVTSADIADRTGVSDRQTKQFDNAAAVGLMDGNAQGRFTVGNIAFGTSQELNDGSVADPYVRSRFDVDGNGTIEVGQDDPDLQINPNYNPDNHQISQVTGENVIQVNTLTVGGERVVRAAEVPNFNAQDIVYLPADAAQKMHAGMVVHSREAQRLSAGAVGIFGIKTTAGQMADQAALQAQRGTGVGYAGIATAVVARDPGQNGAEGGLYEGVASAEVNFENNTLEAGAILTRDRTAFNVGQTDTITMTSSNTFNANGGVTGSASYSGLVPDETVTGQTEGQFYGSNAETLGMTYIGNGTDARIAGGLLVNRTDD